MVGVSSLIFSPKFGTVAREELKGLEYKLVFKLQGQLGGGDNGKTVGKSLRIHFSRGCSEVGLFPSLMQVCFLYIGLTREKG